MVAKVDLNFGRRQTGFDEEPPEPSLHGRLGGRCAVVVAAEIHPKRLVGNRENLNRWQPASQVAKSSCDRRGAKTSCNRNLVTPELAVADMQAAARTCA
ncbi:MAG TPA: hypothetical protein VJS19_04010 [Candidatus Dormibacteraeota bacterium]|nr:hypothetical protein [Candidatus Dormibacteraeota bacterium]